jgi:excisionase family DNA binding protein
MQPRKVLVSLKEFSQLTGLSLRTITKLVAANEVDTIRVGRRRLISRVALEQFIQRDHPLTLGARKGISALRTKAVHRKKVGR